MTQAPSSTFQPPIVITNTRPALASSRRITTARVLRTIGLLRLGCVMMLRADPGSSGAYWPEMEDIAQKTIQSGALRECPAGRRGGLERRRGARDRREGNEAAKRPRGSLRAWWN